MGLTIELMTSIMECFPTEWGTVSEIWSSNDDQEDRFIVFLEDNIYNWSTRLSISNALESLVNVIPLVGEERALDYIDISPIRTVIDHEQRAKISLYFLKCLLLTGPEYCAAISTTNFRLCGMEDKEIYLFADQSWDRRRALAITENLLHRMKENSTATAAMVCCRNIYKVVSEQLRSRNIAHAYIIPLTTTPDDYEQYQKRLQDRSSIYLNLMQDTHVLEHVVPPKDWEALQLELAERARTEADLPIESRLPEHVQMLRSQKFKELSRDEKRAVVEMIPFQFAFDILGPEETERIYGRNEARFLAAELLLSDGSLETYSDAELAAYVHDKVLTGFDVERILASPNVSQRVKDEITRQDVDEEYKEWKSRLDSLSDLEYETLDKVLKDIPGGVAKRLLSSDDVPFKIQSYFIFREFKGILEEKTVPYPGYVGRIPIAILLGVTGLILDKLIDSHIWFLFTILGIFALEGIYGVFFQKRKVHLITWGIYSLVCVIGFYFGGTPGILGGILVAIILDIYINRKPYKAYKQFKQQSKYENQMQKLNDIFSTPNPRL